MHVSKELQRLIQERLDSVWKVCKEAGTTDTSAIISTLAALYTRGRTGAFDEDIRPTKPRNSYNVDTTILLLLNELEGKIDAGTLFDRYILFQDPRLGKTGTLLIPRHIVDCMVSLLEVAPTHSFADLACGAGGGLVNSNRKDNLLHGTTVGIDPSSDAIRLAVANAILHNISAEHIQFYVGNAFDLCATHPDLKGRNFDRIVVAPPFGTAENDERVSALYWTDKDGGSSREDLFTRMALQKLNDKGMAALIVPLSLTSKSTGGMPALRRKLVQEYTIHAILSLPENALAPFNSNTRVCMLFIQNLQPMLGHQPWLFKVRKDGYRAGPSRNLLADPLQEPDENDLPFAEAAIKQRLVATSSGLSYAYITYEQSGATNKELLRGVVLQIGIGSRLQMIRLFTAIKNDVQQNYLLITTFYDDAQATYTVIPLTKEIPAEDTIRGFVEQQEARDYLHQHMGGGKGKDLLEGRRIFQDGLAGQKLAIAQDGHLLGMTLPLTEVSTPDYRLQPERYIPLPEVQFYTDSSIQQLNQFQQDNYLITNYTDSLLSQLEVKPITGKELPPPLHTSAGGSLVHGLGPEQRSLWDKIERWTIDAEGKSYAQYFVSSQLYDGDTSRNNKLRVQQTLDLFVRMGMLVNIIVTVPGKKDRISCYRRVVTHDETKFSLERPKA